MVRELEAAEEVRESRGASGGIGVVVAVDGQVGWVEGSRKKCANTSQSESARACAVLFFVLSRGRLVWLSVCKARRKRSGELALSNT